MGRFVIALAAALVVSGLGMFAPTSAVADDFGTCSSTTGCRADDANMDYHTPYAWDPTVWGAPFVAAMMNLDSQTDMYDTYMAPCTSQTDIGGYLDTSPEYPMGSELPPGASSFAQKRSRATRLLVIRGRSWSTRAC